MAMGLRLLAMIATAVMFALVKWLSEHGVNLVETLFYRQLLQLPVALIVLLMGPGLGVLRTRRIGAHFSRTAMGMLGMVLNFGAFILLPLAEATAIGFTMPIFATLLSVLFLGERPGIHRWIAVVTGFVGAMVIIGPFTGTAIPVAGVAVAFGASIVTAMISLLLRKLSQSEPTTAIVFYFAALSVPFLAVGMIWYGQAHDPFIFLMLITMGVFGGVAQFFMTSALRLGPVSLVLPMDYSSLLWSTALGWLLWNAWPGPGTWIGGLIIAGSSIYIAWRERIRHRETIAAGVSVS